MIDTYQGESDRILVEIKDGDGIVIDPSAGALSDMRVFIVHRVSFEVIAQFSKVPATGFTVFSVVQEPSAGNYKAECILNSSKTIESQQGMYEIQVDLYVPDAKFEGGAKIFRQKGILMNLNPAING